MVDVKVKVLRELRKLFDLVGLGLALLQELRQVLGKLLRQLLLVGHLLLLPSFERTNEKKDRRAGKMGCLGRVVGEWAVGARTDFTTALGSDLSLGQMERPDAFLTQALMRAANAARSRMSGSSWASVIRRDMAPQALSAEVCSQRASTT